MVDSSLTSKQKPVRVWADGCFDFTHWGHANALRQAKALGDFLVVGVHSDADIIQHKGPPVMTEAERYKTVRACKWVDEVVEAAPYVTQLSVLDEHNIDFCVHGEDITTDEDGNDCYGEVKAAGRYRTIKRTDGVSTTEIVGRMLLCSKRNRKQSEDGPIGDVDPKSLAAMSDARPVKTKVSHFVPSSRRIAEFSRGSRSPTVDDKIVYIDGGFDLFHIGHIEALRVASDLGTYLIVGVHDDQTMTSIKGPLRPIMNLHERVLALLSCRYVDEVIIGAPWIVDKAFIEQLRIQVVAQGTVEEFPDDASDPYEQAKELGVYHRFESPTADFNTETVISRVLGNFAAFQARNQAKAKSQARMESNHEKHGISYESLVKQERERFGDASASKNL